MFRFNMRKNENDTCSSYRLDAHMFSDWQKLETLQIQMLCLIMFGGSSRTEPEKVCGSLGAPGIDRDDERISANDRVEPSRAGGNRAK